jgi:hypothetical protein
LGPLTLREKTSPKIFTDAYEFIFQGMRDHQVKRIIAIGTPYIHDPKDADTLKVKFANAFIRIFASGIYAIFQAIGSVFDKDGQDLEWTIVRVGQLVDSKAAVKVGRLGDSVWTTSTSRDGAAEWLVEFVGKGALEYYGERPALSS